MKKATFSIVLFLICLLIHGCSKSKEDALIGTWKTVPKENGSYTLQAFTADGRARLGDNKYPDLVTATYKWVNDDQVQITEENGRQFVLNIEINGDELQTSRQDGDPNVKAIFYRAE